MINIMYSICYSLYVATFTGKKILRKFKKLIYFLYNTVYCFVSFHILNNVSKFVHSSQWLQDTLYETAFYLFTFHSKQLFRLQLTKCENN